MQVENRIKHKNGLYRHKPLQGRTSDFLDKLQLASSLNYSFEELYLVNLAQGPHKFPESLMNLVSSI